MALKDTWVPIRFVEGIDTESDAKVVTPGTPTAIINGVFKDASTVEKRFGTDRLDRDILGDSYRYMTGTIGAEARDDGEDLVVLSSTDEVLSRLDGGYVVGGRWVHSTVDTLGLPRTPYEAWDPTTASTGTIRLTAWEDARGGIYARMMDGDRSFGEPVRLGGSAGRRPRAITVGNRFQVYFTSGSTLNVAVINATSAPSISASYVQLHPSLFAANPVYDVVSLGTSARLATNTSGTIILSVINADGGIGASGSFPSRPDPKFISGSAIAGPSLYSKDNALLIGYKLAAASSPIIVRSFRADTLVDVTGPLTIDGATEVRLTTGAVRRLAVAIKGDTELQAYAEMSASNPVNRYVRQGVLDLDGDPNDTSRSGSLVRHSSLASKPFEIAGSTFLWVNHPGPLQSTDFLVRDDGLIVGRSGYALSYPDVSGTIANVDVVGSTAYRACTRRDLLPLPGTSGSTFSSRHIRLSTFEHHPRSAWRPVDIDGVLHFGGGWLGTYDGSNVVEHGFSLTTEGVTLSGTLGSNIASGSYAYAVVPEKFDAKGNRHLGGFISYRTALTASMGSVTVTWPTIAHTMNDGTHAPDLRFAVYRTGPNGTVYQRVDDPSRPIVNSTGSDTMTWVDSTTEAVRRLGEVLYTEAEPMNVMPPSPAHVAATGDRMYLAGLDGYPYEVAVSKLRLGGAIAFTDDGFLDVDADGGPVTGLAGIDGNIAVFKRNRVYRSDATGPTNSVLDNIPWPEVRLITSDVGAPAPSTIVSAANTQAQGLIFKSLRGFRLLDRGFTTVGDIGGPVRDFDRLTVVGGVSSERDETVRFYTAEGTTLAYNAKYGKWSTFDGQHAAAAALWQGRPTYLARDGFAYVEDSGSYYDGSTPYSLTIELGWMGFGGLQTEGRVREFGFLGNYHSPHTLRLEVAYDHRDSWITVREMPTSSTLSVTPYGGPPGYGSGPYGGQDSVYQFTFLSPWQRVRAFRLRISDHDQDGSGASYSMTELKVRLALDKQKGQLPLRKRR